MKSVDEPHPAQQHRVRADAALGAEGPRLIHRQRKIRADWNEVERFLNRATEALGNSSVCLVSDRAMKRFNGRFRHKDEPTDVLSFPASENGAASRLFLGDILI